MGGEVRLGLAQHSRSWARSPFLLLMMISPGPRPLLHVYIYILTRDVRRLSIQCAFC